MIAGLLADSVVAIIALGTVVFFAVGMYMFGAMHGWEPTPREDRDGSGLERIRCPACNGIKFRGEPHVCPTPARQINPLHVATMASARYDRPVPAPPVPLPPPGVRDPIEARARP